MLSATNSTPLRSQGGILHATAVLLPGILSGHGVHESVFRWGVKPHPTEYSSPNNKSAYDIPFVSFTPMRLRGNDDKININKNYIMMQYQ